MTEIDWKAEAVSREYQVSTGITRSQEDAREVSTQSLRGSMVGLTPWFWTSSLQNCKRTDFCCFDCLIVMCYGFSKKLITGTSVSLTQKEILEGGRYMRKQNRGLFFSQISRYSQPLSPMPLTIGKKKKKKFKYFLKLCCSQNCSCDTFPANEISTVCLTKRSRLSWASLSCPPSFNSSYILGQSSHPATNRQQA